MGKNGKNGLDEKYKYKTLNEKDIPNSQFIP